MSTHRPRWWVRAGAALDRPNPRLKLAAICFSVLALVGVGVSDLIIQIQRGGDQRTTQQEFTDFRTCVNRYARLQHQSQTIRGQASAEFFDKIQAVIEENTKLWTLVSKQLQTGHMVPTAQAENAVGEYLSAAAQEHALLIQYQQARKDNPIPEPPAVACPAASQ